MARSPCLCGAYGYEGGLPSWPGLFICWTEVVEVLECCCVRFVVEVEVEELRLTASGVREVWEVFEIELEVGLDWLEVRLELTRLFNLDLIGIIKQGDEGCWVTSSF